MLRLVHTADVHLGARHVDMGERAAAQRERQWAAFRATVDLALTERVDLFLVAGDLFDSNTQPRRVVEGVASELGRLAGARIRSVIIPGTHDVYDRSSVYRAHDLASLAGQPPDSDYVTVLTPDSPEIHLASIDAVVFGRVFDTKRAPRSPLHDFSAAADHRATWRIGMIHGSLLIPGQTDGDEVVFRREEVIASGLDYLALGHWHGTQQWKAGHTTFAYSGAPEPVAVDQDKAGSVLLVTLDQAGDRRTVEVAEQVVGQTRFEAETIDATTVGGQPELVERLARKADPNVVLDVVIDGVRPDELDLDTAEVEAALRDRFLGVRVRDRSTPALTDGPLPPQDTIAGAFIRDLEGRIGEADKAGRADEALELREALRLGRLLLAGHEVTL
ncbi:MAG TPA: DNA repair exonuclease [Candidatus Limnocylindrales bacterium]|nr:DNA repair exonuclease [Candidatus Limnocylindrales bacterium]